MNDALRDQVEEALGSVIDPELGIDIVSLGLLYGIAVYDGGIVHILMTLTTPGCPMHDTIANDVDRVIRDLSWVSDVKVQVTYSPPWTPERLTPRARALLGR